MNKNFLMGAAAMVVFLAVINRVPSSVPVVPTVAGFLKTVTG